LNILDYSSFIGRIAIGRVKRGSIRVNQPVSLVKRDGSILKSRVKELFTFEGLGKIKVEEVVAGDICGVFGIENFEIGDTIAEFENPEGMVPIQVDEPTMCMLFTINNSPFFGKEGKFVTSRHIRERLEKELEKNLAMRMEETDTPDAFLVYGRGILHLSILIETMRREGYELQVGQPRVIVKEIDGVKCEPIELLTIDVPEAFSGKVIELISQRKGEMTVMEQKGDLTHIEFNIPSRGLIGLRNMLLTASAGEAIIAHRFKDFEPWKGAIPSRVMGVFVSKEMGACTAYSIGNLQDRGSFFIDPGDQIYVGQVIGEHIRPGDLVVNVITGKKLTNMRASGSDGTTQITPKRNFSLEEALEYIQEDEYLEATPKSLRLRKVILDENERKKASRQVEMAE
jgi:GTP-binding protein